ncbi:hypothetical protein OG21DRAFT_1101670 [Imleria badia]|nr:hypothetical protein OG21DRAFT_1101670 [Imleria badia]
MSHVVQAVSKAPAFSSVTAPWNNEVMSLPPLALEPRATSITRTGRLARNARCE